jgi:hypothetical protein
MPDLNSLPVPQYQSNQPYHWEYDNLPLKTLADRDELINGVVNVHQEILRNCSGTVGTLANRLNQSIQEDGNLSSVAVDESLHNIAEHTDGAKTISAGDLLTYQELGYPSISNPVPFVRMLEAERNKLAIIADESTKLTIDVNTPSLILTFGDGSIDSLNLIESSSIQWTFEAPNSVKPEIKFSLEYAHRHYYDLEPITSNYLNYSVTGVSTPYIEDSLRVFINGIRINSEYDVYVPNQQVTVWTANKFTPNHLLGTFALSTAISYNDIIRIDFDVSVT